MGAEVSLEQVQEWVGGKEKQPMSPGKSFDLAADGRARRHELEEEDVG